jgi:DNA polymerase III delta prime subunit
VESIGIWVEKYRPRKLEDMVGCPQELRNQKIDVTLNHQLFVGPAGTGKTTAARIIIHMLNADSIVLNASKERGIDVIRNKVTNFCMKKSDRMKIVFLDEADQLTTDAQEALRNMMETYYRSTRFILTGNHAMKITSAIKSRCVSVEFGCAEQADVVKYLAKICDAEKVTYNEEDLASIVAVKHPDIRNAIHTLFSCVTDDGNGGKTINRDKIHISKEVNDAILELVRCEQDDALRLTLSTYPPDYDQLFRAFFDVVWATKTPNTPTALCVIGEHMWRNGALPDKEINFVCCVLEVRKHVKLG